MPADRPPPRWGYHVPFRFQIEPNDTPYRDTRWVQLVVGLCLVAVGGFLLVTWAVLASVASVPMSLVYGFGIPGALLVAVGVLLALLGLVRTLAPTRP
jgi:hypothetical protein